MRILHIITSLDAGGAQGVLLNILGQLKFKGHQQAVISMKLNGELAKQVADLGIPLVEIPFLATNFFRKKSRVDEVVASFQPQIIQSWMYHADFLTIFLSNPRQIPIVWGVHHTFENIHRNRLKSLTKLIVRLNAAFSRLTPTRVICCSTSALGSHTRIGYETSKLVYIPNGIDAERFRPDPQARTLLRQELGLSPRTPLVGYIARYHPQKDHALFFSAANLLLKKQADVHFVLAGDQVETGNPDIKSWMRLSSAPDHFHFLGKRTDLPMLTAGLDVATLASSGDEAFPLTVIEAMACAIPCVATDVGDVRQMLGPGGRLVPPQAPAALAEGWLSVLGQSPEQRNALGQALRERVIEYFTNSAMAAEYLKLYNQIIKPLDLPEQAALSGSGGDS